MTKRAVLPALMMALLLSGCGGAGTEARLEARRDALAEARALRFTADMTADLGETVFECTLRCEYTPEQVTAAVLSPETVAGVTAVLTGAEAAMRFEGLELSVGRPEDLSPFAAAPMLFDALRAGHILRAWQEGSLLAAEVYAGEDLGLTLWFDAETLTPARAAFTQDGRRVLNCTLREFQIE